MPFETLPHSIIHISCPKKRTSTGFFTNWQAMHLSDKCADLLVGSCSQSLQTSDFHLLIYAPLRGAEYFSANARNKKRGTPPNVIPMKCPLGLKCLFFCFCFFSRPGFLFFFKIFNFVSQVARSRLRNYVIIFITSQNDEIAFISMSNFIRIRNSFITSARILICVCIIPAFWCR